MIGILLVTHNDLGNSLVDCVRHVLGKVPENVRVLSVLAEDDPEAKEQEGRTLIQQLDQGDGVLVLCDVFGATPANIAQKLVQMQHVSGVPVSGVSGVNLPMLLKVLVCSQERTLEEMTQRALDGGRDCIIEMNLKDGSHDVATRCGDH